MGAFPAPLQRLIELIGELPGIGEQTAERLAFHLLQAEKGDALALAAAIAEVKERLRPCSRCCAATPEVVCAICADPARDASMILVVETEREVAAFERMGGYSGLYHVLGGRASAAEGRRYAAKALALLKERARSGSVKEVILGTNPDKVGDLARGSVMDVLAGSGVQVTRLARGLPQGATIEYLGSPILAEALSERRAWDGRGAGSRDAGDAKS